MASKNTKAIIGLVALGAIIISIWSTKISAKSGCCSHHSGVAYCGNSGYYICGDGTQSPSCTCYIAPPPTNPPPAPVFIPAPTPIYKPSPNPVTTPPAVPVTTTPTYIPTAKTTTSSTDNSGWVVGALVVGGAIVYSKFKKKK